MGKELIYVDGDFITKDEIDISDIYNELKKNSLIINQTKTEIVKINHKKSNSLNLKKLRTILSMKQEIRNPKALTIAAMNKLWKLRKRSTINKEKVRLFNAYVMPILLYNCGTWAFTKTDETSLNSFHRRLSRRVAGVYWPKILKSDELYMKNKNTRAESDHKFTLFGHILRLDPNTLAQRAMNNYFLATSKPLAGRPKTTLPTALKKDLKARNIMLDCHEDLLKLRIRAKDRASWKKLFYLCS